MKMINDALWRRFMAKVEKTDGCWLWKASLSDNRYGNFHLPTEGGKITAHRASYRIFVGPIPKGKWVLHECDNERCVNPFHLFLGDARANSSDMVRKKRQAFGRRHPQALLVDGQVIEMRRLYIAGTTAREIAGLFGVTLATVYSAVRYNWKHIPLKVPLR